MPKLRNPGGWSVAIFAVACLLVGTMYYFKAPEAGKLGAELVALALAAFGAKSALKVETEVDPEEAPDDAPPSRKHPGKRLRQDTWPGFDDEGGTK